MTRVDILSPHYDDAVLSCWEQVEQPDSRVITVFGGAPDVTKSGAWDSLTTQTSASETVNIRQAENRQALLGTPATYLDLPLLDRQYEPFKRRDIAETADTIEQHLTGETQILAAAGIGTLLRFHPDHVATRKAALALSERGHDVAFYADIPYTLPVRNFDNWPERISAEKLKRIMDRDVTIEPQELTPEQQQRKQTAVRAFTSQFPMVNRLALGALSNPGAYKWEAIIRLV